MKIYMSVLVVLLCLSCSETHVKQDFVIEEPELLNDSIRPDAFELKINKVTDVSINITWPVKSDLLYDLAVNDSVVCCDAQSGNYTFTSLRPNSNYLISVLAYNSQRNMTRVDVKQQTMKSYLDAVLSYDLDYESYHFCVINEASDQGLLIYGLDKTDGQAPFFLKTNANFEIQFIKRVDEALLGVDFISAEDNNSYALAKNTLYKLDENGQELWSFVNPSNEEFAQFYALTLNGDHDVLLAASSSVGTYIYRLSSDGNLIWSIKEEKATLRTPSDIYVNEKNDIMVAGNAMVSSKEQATLLWFNQDGAFLKKLTFPNKYNGSDYRASIIPKSAGGYFLQTSASGYRPPYSWWGIEPRIISLDEKGDTIADYYPIGSVYASFINGYYKSEEDNEIKYLVGDDGDKNHVYTIAADGKVVSNELLPSIPKCRFINYYKNGDFYLVSESGFIIFFCHDGYR